MAHIKNPQQYHAACDRINQLLRVVHNDTPCDDPNLLELDLLSDAVADYEEEHFPIVRCDYPNFSIHLHRRAYSPSPSASCDYPNFSIHLHPIQ